MLMFVGRMGVEEGVWVSLSRVERWCGVVCAVCSSALNVCGGLCTCIYTHILQSCVYNMLIYKGIIIMVSLVLY